jgi:peptidoglycan/LPS O-acetylase OafA/YrhL
MRIYPLYLLILIIVLLKVGTDNFTWFITLTLLKGLFEAYKFHGLAVAWTLTVEMTFYLFIPLIFYWRKRHISWGNILIGFWATGLLLWVLGSQLSFYTFFNSFQFVSIYTFFGRSFEFLIGLWLGIKLATERKKPLLGFSLTGSGLVLMSMSVM